MSDIVDRLTEDPCNTLNDKDVEVLRSVDEGTLKRFALGLLTQQQSVQNQAEDVEEVDDDAVQIAGLQDALNLTQKNIKKLIGEEKEIRAALKEYGIQTPSVVERSVAVTNQAPPRPEDLPAETVWQWVMRSPHQTAVHLREGLSALSANRKQSIDIIVRNSNNAYSEAELKHMSVHDLQKLAQVLEVRNQQYPQDMLSWEGVGLADQSVNQTPAFRTAAGGVLDLPTAGYPSTNQ